jgi:protein arginine kinase
MKLLSRVRLGQHLGRLPETDPTIISQLFLLVQPAHLQRHTGRALSADELREARATFVRERLA